MEKNKIFFRGGYKYQLHFTHTCHIPIKPKEAILTDYIHLSQSGKMIIKRGYAWDGASGPTIDTQNTFRASLYHDACYGLMKMGKLPIAHRKQADEVLRDTLREDGMSRLRSWIWYRAVRRCAKKSALPENRRKLRSAP